jgi:hypothetical protein
MNVCRENHFVPDLEKNNPFTVGLSETLNSNPNFYTV